MNDAVPFVNLFPDLYPERRSVRADLEPNLVGVLIKSVLYHNREEALLCRGLVVTEQAEGPDLYATVTLRLNRLPVLVGYDMDLMRDQHGEEETWESVRKTWFRHFVADPAQVRALHLDIVREVNAKVFPLKRVSLAKKYFETVKGALTFGDFCPDKGYYLTREGNTPALCADVMYGRVYFVPRNKMDSELSPRDLVYDHDRSEVEAKLFDAKHAPFFYRAACLDVETVCDDAYRDADLRSDSFAGRFPFCTEGTVADLARGRIELIRALDSAKDMMRKVGKKIVIPVISPDVPGQQHEITCVSLVVLNSHVVKTSGHRKKLLVLYNGDKVKGDRHPVADRNIASAVGIADVDRVRFHRCSGELALLEKTVQTLHRHGIELLYVYNAEFDVRVIQQRVYFYADSDYVRRQGPALRQRCSSLLRAWLGLFVTRSLADDVVPSFRFENVRYLELYKAMLRSLGAALLGGDLTEPKLRLASLHVEKFNKEKSKIGQFKMNACGMNVVDLYRMAMTRDVRFACTSMKLNDVAPYVISKFRELNRRPPKDAGKLRKLADVPYSKLDEMIAAGGESLFAVLVYNLVDSQLCARLARALRPVSALFHRCRTTLNVDVVAHGRGDTFCGFVQSIHSVQIPQLKFRFGTLRVNAGPAGKSLNGRLRWDPTLRVSDLGGVGEEWLGGQVSDPLTGLHYSGPGVGLELCFDFSSMYPSIMCALNVSQETTIPWPPAKFPHDLSGWVCYRWEAEGFEYASLILKYDRSKGEFVRAPGVFPSAVEHYLEMRAEFKRKLANPDLGQVERSYCKVQEAECKVMANSFYGTSGPVCGPLLAAHGRRQISLVNRCVSTFFQRAPTIYGDTDSVMVSVGYGPGDRVEPDLAYVDVLEAGARPDADVLRAFARDARFALGEKFKRVTAAVPDFLDHVHKVLVGDALERMYVIGRGNVHRTLTRDAGGALTCDGHPVYTSAVPGEPGEAADVTGPFVKDRRVRLEYENSASVYCHVTKKAYVALTHRADGADGVSSASVKAKGLSAHKCVRSPSDSAVTDAFLACVMRGDCVKLEEDSPRCFATCPWHKLGAGDVILYPKREPAVDEVGVWAERREASSFLVAHRVLRVTVLRLDSGFSAVAAEIVQLQTGHPIGSRTLVKTLYKDEMYCMNHVISRKEGIVRDLLACKATELAASRIGAGFFPWSGLIKYAKTKCFGPRTLDRMRVSRSAVKTSYVEIVKTNLMQIAGLSVKPVQCHEYHKCHPCEATFFRYPLKVPDVLASVFGGALNCQATCSEPAAGAPPASPRDDLPGREFGAQVISHPYQPLGQCFADSRVLLAHRADLELINGHMKLVPHCVVDYCLPRHMYSSALGASSVRDCRRELLRYADSMKGRLTRARLAFNSLMNNCPEHMLPACGAQEWEKFRTDRETLSRIPVDKLQVCAGVILEDMGLGRSATYRRLSAQLGVSINRAAAQGLVSLGTGSSGQAWLSLTVPTRMLVDAGVASSSGSLWVARSESCQSALVDLAGLLYQTALALQVVDPDAFDLPRGLYPEKTLRIMPYSCADRGRMRLWIETFRGMKWLTAAREPKPSLKRRSSVAHGQVTYHCAGCKNFYRDLFANRVRGDGLIQSVYGPDKRRKLGRCIHETHLS